MNDTIFSGNFADTQLTFAFRHPDTPTYFSGWLNPLSGKSTDKDTILIPKSDCECWIRDFGMQDDGNTEFGMSVYRASDILLNRNRCVIHGAAMLWKNKAWLFIADSGTGKSTQIKHWQTLYPKEVSVINGDKPILRLKENNIITVHPSPWKGKEEWGDDSLSATLGGIIILKQGAENQIKTLRPVHCASRLLSLFFSRFETVETVYKLCRFEEAIFNTTPIWQLTNIGDLDSARLTHDILFKEGMSL